MDQNVITKEQAWEELIDALCETKDRELMSDFMKSLLTEYEVDEVANRWALVRLIDRGMSQRAISKSLGLSLCKITRGSKELKKENSSFARMINLQHSPDSQAMS